MGSNVWPFKEAGADISLLTLVSGDKVGQFEWKIEWPEIAKSHVQHMDSGEQLLIKNMDISSASSALPWAIQHSRAPGRLLKIKVHIVDIPLSFSQRRFKLSD